MNTSIRRRQRKEKVAFSSDVNALTLKLQLNTVVLPEILVVKIGASLAKMWILNGVWVRSHLWSPEYV